MKAAANAKAAKTATLKHTDTQDVLASISAAVVKGKSAKPADPDTEKKLQTTAKTPVAQEPPKKAKEPKAAKEPELKIKPAPKPKEPVARKFRVRITGYMMMEWGSEVPMRDRVEQVLAAIKADPNQFLMINPGYSCEAQVRQLHEVYASGLGCPQDKQVAAILKPRYSDRDRDVK